MAEVDWLRAENGVLVFVNAGKHNGISAKARALASERQRKKRSRPCHDSVTPKVGRFSSPLSNGSKEGVPGEKPEQKSVIPLLISTEAFAAAWTAWLQHRREIKKPVTPGSQTEKEQLKTLEEWGETRAIEAIRYTIFKGWQGIREPDPKDKDYANHRTSSGRGFSQQGSYAGVTDT
jgi:hypothetical protein